MLFQRLVHGSRRRTSRNIPRCRPSRRLVYSSMGKRQSVVRLFRHVCARAQALRHANVGPPHGEPAAKTMGGSTAAARGGDNPHQSSLRRENLRLQVGYISVHATGGLSHKMPVSARMNGTHTHDAWPHLDHTKSSLV